MCVRFVLMKNNINHMAIVSGKVMRLNIQYVMYFRYKYNLEFEQLGSIVSGKLVSLLCHLMTYKELLI